MKCSISGRGAAWCKSSFCGTLAWVEVERPCRLFCGTALGRQGHPGWQPSSPACIKVVSAVQNAWQCSASSKGRGAAWWAWQSCLGPVGAECRWCGREGVHLRQGRCQRRPRTWSWVEVVWQCCAVLCSVVHASRPKHPGFCGMPCRGKAHNRATSLSAAQSGRATAPSMPEGQAALPGSTACDFETDLSAELRNLQYQGCPEPKSL